VQVIRDSEHTGATPGRIVYGPGWRGWPQNPGATVSAVPMRAGGSFSLSGQRYARKGLPVKRDDSGSVNEHHERK
jgi:hypothetical protein